MDVKINQKSDTKKEIEVIIPVSEMSTYISKAAKKAESGMNIKGFRAGHAPQEVIENTIGKEKLYEEAAKIAIEETYPQIIKENKFFALGDPQVDLIKCTPGNEVIYKAQVYVLPKISLPEYKDIAKDVVQENSTNVSASDKEITDSLNRIAETKAKTQKVDREAQKGDAVIVNFKGIIGDNEEKKIEENNFQINLGKGELQILKGFEDNLYKMKAGDKKNFQIDIPKDKKSGKELSGQKINFDVEMVTVMERELPEINNEFAQSFPNIKNIDQLKEKIKEGIEKEKQVKEQEKLKVMVLEKLKKETAEFEIPEILIEKELDNMLKTAENQLQQNNSTLDNYLQEIGKTKDDLRKEWNNKAKENVSYALILHAISDKEEIKAETEEIEEEVERYFRATGKTKENENEENLQRLRAYIHDTIKNQKVFKLLSIEQK